MVKGFKKLEGVDFGNIFSLVVNMRSIWVVLGLDASLDLEVEKMDVKTSFLHGDLHEEIYMEKPNGLWNKGNQDYVCKFIKSLWFETSTPLMVSKVQLGDDWA